MRLTEADGIQRKLAEGEAALEITSLFKIRPRNFGIRTPSARHGEMSKKAHTFVCGGSRWKLAEDKIG